MTNPALPQWLRLRLSRSDAIRLAASLILAILLWGWVTNAQDPETARTFTNVDVTVGELPAPLQVVGSIPDVNVRVVGPRSVIRELESSDITASLELGSINKPGDYTVPIKLETPRGVWNSSSTPSRLPIRVEETVTELFVIEAVTTGNVDATRQVSANVTDTSEITVVGPRSSVDRVARVIAPVEIANQTQSFTTAVTPEAIDDHGNPIPEVSLSPNTVTVDVDIDTRGKRVAVLTQLEGSPAQGYEVVDRTIIPATILVDGPDAVVDQLISVSTEPVDISGASATLTRRVSISGLPEGVHVIDPPSGAVDVVIQIRQLGVRQPLPAQTIQVVGLGEGLTAEVTPNAVAVTVVAPEERLGSLTTNDLSVQVNVSGLGPGTYQLTPIVALPPSVTWVGSDPPTVTVTISSLSSPPAGPATATPTS